MMMLMLMLIGALISRYVGKYLPLNGPLYLSCWLALGGAEGVLWRCWDATIQCQQAKPPSVAGEPMAGTRQGPYRHPR